MEYKNKSKTLLFGQDVESMVCHGLRKCMKDFHQIEADYKKAQENIIQQLGEEAQWLCQSVSNQVCAVLLFAGVQGLRMNCDHFRNPLMPDCTWPQLDYDNCVRIEQVYEMPEYRKAKSVQEKYWQKITVADSAVEDAIREYQSTMETAGIKLAHYYGYLFGNEILPYCLPGYCADPVLTLRYKHILGDYFDETADLDLFAD